MRRRIILVVLIIVLISGFIAFNKAFNNNGKNHKSMFSNKVFESFKAGDVVSFKGKSWYVLYDSTKKDNYVTLISDSIISIDDDKILYVLDGIYETSNLKTYLEKNYANELGIDNLVEKNGYSIRLFNEDDMKNLLHVSYNREDDSYTIDDCPEYICLTNVFYATMIDTKNVSLNEDIYTSLNDIEDIDFGDYKLHMKYYNLNSTYETYRLESIVDNPALFVRPVINVYKDSLDDED